MALGANALQADICSVKLKDKVNEDECMLLSGKKEDG